MIPNSFLYLLSLGYTWQCTGLTTDSGITPVLQELYVVTGIKFQVNHMKDNQFADLSFQSPTNLNHYPLFLISSTLMPLQQSTEIFSLFEILKYV